MNSSNPHESSNEVSDDGEFKLHRNKNASQVFIRDSKFNQVATDELFKRLSLTTEKDRSSNKRFIHKKEPSNFQMHAGFDLFINKVNLCQPIDQMNDEEREFSLANAKSEEIKKDDNIYITGSIFYKNTKIVNNEEEWKIKHQSISKNKSPRLGPKEL